MALNQTTKIALAVAFFGSLSFIFGVIAENKKVPFPYLYFLYLTYTVKMNINLVRGTYSLAFINSFTEKKIFWLLIFQIT